MLKVITPVLGPIWVVEGRAIISCLVLLGYASWVRQMPNWRKNTRAFWVLGLVNVAVPFTLLSYASLHLPAAMAAILNATAPLFSAVLAVLWLKSPFRPAQWVGLGLGVGWGCWWAGAQFR